MKIKISKPFGANTPVDDYDVRQVKHALNRLGYYTPNPKLGMTEIADKAVFQGVMNFQQAHQLPITGALKPGDETEIALNKVIKSPPDGHYIWRTAGDERVRPEHAALNGTIRNWSESPNPTEEYNCRCYAELISESEIEREELPPTDEKSIENIPGTNIPDYGVEEYEPSPKPDRSRGRIRTIIPPAIDPGMELPYDPDNPKFNRPKWDDV